MTTHQTAATVHGLPSEPSVTPVNRTWATLYARYLAGLAYDIDPASELPADDEAAAIVAEQERLQRELLLFPAPDAAALSEKFRVFREFLGDDFEIFWDRRELLFLAALEADALRLAETTES